MNIFFNYNKTKDIIYIFKGSIVANIIIYFVFLYNRKILKKIYSINSSLIDLIFNISIIIGSIYTGQYISYKFYNNKIHIYYFFILVVLIQLIKRLIMAKLYNITKYKIFYSNLKFNYKLIILDMINILLSLFISILFKKHYI